MLDKGDDPGRKWRRLARCGALACTLATVLPFENGRILWGYADQLYDHAVGHQLEVDRGAQGWFVVAFCCMAVPYFFAGPVYLLVCSSKSIEREMLEDPKACNGPRRPLHLAVLHLLWLATALTPYVAVWCQLSARQTARDTIGIVISVLSGYLLICALTLLASWRAWKSSLAIFSMGLLPLGVLNLAATCLMGALLLSARGPLGWVHVDVPLAFFGAFALLVGWLKWWGAVKAAVRASTPAIQPARS